MDYVNMPEEETRIDHNPEPRRVIPFLFLSFLHSHSLSCPFTYSMATDLLATAVAPPPHPHPHFPRGFAISDLDLRDDRYPLISSSRHVPPAAHQLQGTKTANFLSSHSHIHPDAMHQPVRGPSLPSSDLVSHDLRNMNMTSLTLPSAQ